MPPSIIDMPMNSVPKPMRMEAISFCRCFFESRRRNAPTATHTGANVAGENSAIAALPDRSPRRRICPVTVVPMFAPIITETP